MKIDRPRLENSPWGIIYVSVQTAAAKHVTITTKQTPLAPESMISRCLGFRRVNETARSNADATRGGCLTGMVPISPCWYWQSARTSVFPQQQCEKTPLKHCRFESNAGYYFNWLSI
jgi:hypothetical protein